MIGSAPERSKVPLRGMSFWEHHLPWALLKILQILSKIKGPLRGRAESARDAEREGGGVC